MRIVNSRNVEPRAKPAADTEREAFEIEHNFKDSGEPSQFQFNEPADWKWTDLHQVPYPHQADSADDVPTLVRKYAGTGKLSDPEQRPSRRRPLPHFQ